MSPEEITQGDDGDLEDAAALDDDEADDPFAGTVDDGPHDPERSDW